MEPSPGDFLISFLGPSTSAVLLCGPSVGHPSERRVVPAAATEIYPVVVIICLTRAGVTSLVCACIATYKAERSNSAAPGPPC